MSDQASNGGATGMILAQHLTEKDPQRDERRIDPVEPTRLDCLHCLRDHLVRKDIAEW
jgi:hypothetical protein